MMRGHYAADRDPHHRGRGGVPQLAPTLTYASSQTVRTNCKTTKIQKKHPKDAKQWPDCKTQACKSMPAHVRSAFLMDVVALSGFATRPSGRCFGYLGSCFCIWSFCSWPDLSGGMHNPNLPTPHFVITHSVAPAPPQHAGVTTSRQGLKRSPYYGPNQV